MSEQQISPAKQANGMAIASLALGVVATLLAVTDTYPAFIPALLAIIFGFIGNSQAKQRNSTGHTMSLWGVFLGFAPLLLAILLMSINAAGSMR